MRKNFSLFFSLLLTTQIFAQSPRTVLIEHFTNTRCSICASKNPAFYSTLANYPQVLHIAFHPSAPYSLCYFSQQNPIENDERTTYYGIYGSTPQIVLNGKILGSPSPLINNTTLDTALGQTSPIEISATEELVGTDSVKVKVTVKTTGVTSSLLLKLFAGVAENPINYNAWNGETVHHDVFRKALTGAPGNLFALPALNDSSVYEFTYAVGNGWDVNNIYTIAFVQRHNTKEILNATKSYRVTAPSSVDDITNEMFSLFPNPSSEKLFLANFKLNSNQRYSVLDVAGRKVMESKLEQNEIDVTELSRGIYFLKLNNSLRRFVKQ
ncbi:MAG: Omp28-related outer membrane protein [Bacteroidetes bacterium]|nr:Omp28-related outer membrane protein [Bacteroidota bacterium]